LISHFGSAKRLFDASRGDLREIRGIGHTRLTNLLNNQFQREAEAEWQLITNKGIRILSYRDPGYPSYLKECSDAPLVLFQTGDINLAGKRLLSIVGTRNMTGYGERFCRKLVEGLVPYDPVIVSGFAHGVDICAQMAAVDLGLETVACLAHGLDRVYPQAHRRYVDKVCAHGGLLTEFWHGVPPEPMHFIRRNRIIAGISRATVIVESASRGGSLVTADLAFGYDREVFAVPGRVGDVYSQGCNSLIGDQKAQLLESADDLASALNWEPVRPPAGLDNNPAPNVDTLGREARRIVDFLCRENDPLLDEIALGCNLPVREAISLLFRLEMDGFVASLPGKRYQIHR
jgi:DNA processing protein